MSVDSNWYRDEAAVRTELQQLRQTTGGPPQIPSYDELREIFRGGQGVVYTARHLSTRRRVAIKVAAEGAFGSSSARRRFEREIELAGGLRHPHIVRVYDSGVTDDGRLYFVMEYVEGMPLDQYVKGSRDQGIEGTRDGSRSAGTKPKIEETLGLFVKICDAVAHAHQRGVIHRDLKPGNIRIDPAGEPHVLDFGVAKVADSVQFPVSSCRPEVGKPTTELDGACPAGNWRLETGNLTLTGEFIGTIAYAAPEQVRGQHDSIDVRTDEYALGVMLYEALTRRLPYGVEDSLAALLDAIRDTEPRPPSAVCPELGVELDAILLKALAKEPAKRYPSVDAFGADLRRYLAGEPIEAKRDSGWYVLRKYMRRYRLPLTIAAGFVVLLLGGFAGTLAMWQRSEQQRRTAEHRRVEAETAVNLLQEMFKPSDPHATRVPNPGFRRMLDDFAAALPSKVEVQTELEATVRAALGAAYRTEREFAKAESHLTAALGIRRRIFGDEHALTASSLCQWGQLLHDKGDVLGAVAAFKDALAVRRRVLGNNHIDVANTLDSLTEALWQRAEYVEAETAICESLAIVERLHGKGHLEACNTLYHLSSILSAQHRFAEAEAAARDALAIYEREFPAEHPSVAAGLGRLADSLMDLGRADEALPRYERTLAIHRQLFGEDSREVNFVLTRLATCLISLRRPSEAVAACEAALATDRRILGDNDPGVALDMAALAKALQSAGDLDQAARVAQEAATILHTASGEHGGTYSQVVAVCDNVLSAASRLDDLETTHRQYLAHCRQNLPQSQPGLSGAIGGLALVLLQREKFAEAEPLIREAIHMRESTLAPESNAIWLISQNRSMLGHALIGQAVEIIGTDHRRALELLTEAEPLIVESFEWLAMHSERISPVWRAQRPREAGERAVRLYEVWDAAEPGRGFAEKAAEWRARFRDEAQGPAP